MSQVYERGVLGIHLDTKEETRAVESDKVVIQCQKAKEYLSWIRFGLV